MSQEAESFKKESSAKLADLMKAISIKDLLLKQKDKEIQDLKASFASEKDDILNDAKMCAAASILESMIKMSDEVQAKGHVMESWNAGAWRKKLKLLRGEDADEEDTAGTSGTAKEAGDGEAVKEAEVEKTAVEKDGGAEEVGKV